MNTLKSILIAFSLAWFLSASAGVTWPPEDNPDDGGDTPPEEDLYQQGYDEGYQVGFEEGQSQGYQEGYDQGLADGKDLGYDEGYQAGLEAGQSSGYEEGYQAGYEQGKEDGYSEGYQIGYSEGYAQGKQEGYAQGQADCQANPDSCNISLESVVGNLGYGETEPNDHIGNADELILGTYYFANSYDTYDYDWYHVQSTAPNQNLLINFLGDPQDYTATGGWIVEVRDLYGNIIAAFNTDLIANTDNNDEGDTPPLEENPPEGTNKEIVAPDWPITTSRTMVVMLGNPGDYYISVRPFLKGSGGPSPSADGSWRAYTIAAVITDSGMPTDNPDTNFYDTETEPNNSQDQADQLHSNVHMFGVFTKTPMRYQDDEGTWHLAYDYDEEWFKFDSNGNETLIFRACAKGGCNFALAHLTIYAPDGEQLYDGPISPGFAYNIGFAQAGTYYFQLTTEVVGIDGDTGVFIVEDIAGPYNFVIEATGLTPGSKAARSFISDLNNLR